MLILKSTLAYITMLALILPVAVNAQEVTKKEKKQEAEIIIIEETIDKDGNKTINKTIRKGNFTDTEIDQIVREETEEDGDRDVDIEIYEQTNKGYLGVTIEDVATEQGVMITDIVEGSPAESAGFEEHDVIKAVAGQTVSSSSELVKMIGEFGAGENVDITYSRDGEPVTKSVTLAKRSDYEKTYKIMNEDVVFPEKADEPKRKLGVYLGHSEQGVKVNDLADGGLAEAAGIHSGDIITSFDGKVVTTSDELIDAIQSAEAGKKIEVKYLRDGEEHTKEVEFDF